MLLFFVLFLQILTDNGIIFEMFRDPNCDPSYEGERKFYAQGWCAPPIGRRTITPGLRRQPPGISYMFNISSSTTIEHFTYDDHVCKDQIQHSTVTVDKCMEWMGAGFLYEQADQSGIKDYFSKLSHDHSRTWLVYENDDCTGDIIHVDFQYNDVCTPNDCQKGTRFPGEITICGKF